MNPGNRPVLTDIEIRGFLVAHAPFRYELAEYVEKVIYRMNRRRRWTKSIQHLVTILSALLLMYILYDYIVGFQGFLNDVNMLFLTSPLLTFVLYKFIQFYYKRKIIIRIIWAWPKIVKRLKVLENRDIWNRREVLFCNADSIGEAWFSAMQYPYAQSMPNNCGKKIFGIQLGNQTSTWHYEMFDPKILSLVCIGAILIILPILSGFIGQELFPFITVIGISSSVFVAVCLVLGICVLMYALRKLEDKKKLVADTILKSKIKVCGRCGYNLKSNKKHKTEYLVNVRCSECGYVNRYFCRENAEE